MSSKILAMQALLSKITLLSTWNYPPHGVVSDLQFRLKTIINSIANERIPGPTIVCLCGSTRFSEAFRDANFSETLAGRIVLTIGCDFKSDAALGLTEADKRRLDELHKRKIDLAGEILVLNVGGYIGESTRNEINYATDNGKAVRYLEPIT
jgi:hypothetical protein